MSERNDIVFTKKFTAEFNTSQDSLKQLASMEWNVDEMFRLVYTHGVDKTDVANIRSLYHYLVYIYADRIYSIAYTVLQDEFQKKEEELEKLYSDWIVNNPGKVPVTLMRKLREYKRWLYEIKQKRVKLGIPTKTEYSPQEAMKKAIEG